MEPKTVRREQGNHPQARQVTPASRSHGLVAGTSVYTVDGLLPVEFITPGDRVISRDRGLAKVIALRHRRKHIQTVLVQANSLGKGRPGQDITLPADLHILLRDWRAKAMFGTPQTIVPIKRLIDGEFIAPLERRQVTLIELIFDSPTLFYADGVEVSAGTALAPL